MCKVCIYIDDICVNEHMEAAGHFPPLSFPFLFSSFLSFPFLLFPLLLSVSLSLTDLERSSQQMDFDQSLQPMLLCLHYQTVMSLQIIFVSGAGGGHDTSSYISRGAELQVFVSPELQAAMFVLRAAL